MQKNSMRRFNLLLACLLLMVLVAPLQAYTIYLKDGSTLIAKEKYRIEDGKALIVLQNGTETFFDAAEIDVEKTDRINKSSYGTAFFLNDDGKIVEQPVTPTEKQRLVDVASRTNTSLSSRGTATRPDTAGSGTTDHLKTAAGFIDMTVIPRTPYRDLEISVEISRFLRSLAVGDFKVFQGTQPKRVFLEMTANSEATIFRNLEAAADTLIHLRNQYPDQVEEMEVLLMTSNRERAGQFLLDEEMATRLGNKNSDTTEFFIANVQF